MRIEWNGIVARLHGDLDLTNADVVLDEIAAHGPCVIDLERATFVDAAGMRALYALYEDHGCVVLNVPLAVTIRAKELGLAFLVGGSERDAGA